MSNNLFALLTCYLKHLGRSQIGILRQTIAVATQTVTTGIESQTSTQTLNEVLVYTLCGLGDSVLVSPVAVILSLLKVGQQLLVDNVAVSAGQIHIIRVVWLETSWNITPGLQQVVVDDGTQCESLAQQMTHVGIVLDVTVLADTLDGKVCALDTFVELSVGVV